MTRGQTSKDYSSDAAEMESSEHSDLIIGRDIPKVSMKYVKYTSGLYFSGEGGKVIRWPV